PDRLVASRPRAVRSRVRLPGGRESHSRLLRKHRAPPPQSRRRPTPQPRPTYGGSDPDDTRSDHPRTRRTPDRRRPHDQGDPPMPQALPGPTDLPNTQRRRTNPHARLTNIEGSLGFVPRRLREYSVF